MKIAMRVAVLILLASAAGASAEPVPTDAELIKRHVRSKADPAPVSGFRHDLGGLWNHLGAVAGHAWQWAKGNKPYVVLAIVALVWIGTRLPNRGVRDKMG